MALLPLGQLLLWAAVTKTENCYHCGQPLTLASQLAVHIDGEARAMCCGGCQAVAQAIVDNGLVDYYRKRDALPEA
ncbi:MAG: heavy metal translocating P-type ATPase metal-binding domain-containing protein, partial [Candidatus Accumulibacter sp.]|uniref:heavy metal translocating P-type ATPase metal-binding domain-containing protein n=1 Tax=Accumulibacter sp. TaxID=2053492 RepID=UPI00287AC8AA